MSCRCFDLAGIGVLVCCEDPEWWRWAEQRLAAFASAADPQWRIDVVVSGPTPGYLKSPLEVYTEPLSVEPISGGATLRSDTFSTRIDVPLARASVRGPRAVYPLDATLRHLLPLALGDGLLVHGAMLADQGRGWVCSGPSGCGKSTLAELLPEHACCDELVAVRRAGERWTVHSLPFWRARPAQAALDAVYLLEHGTAHERRPVVASDAVRRLTPQVLWPTTDGEAVARVLTLLGSLTTEVATWRLAFRPDAGVWSVITS